jgi:hypothetical protein
LQRDKKQHHVVDDHSGSFARHHGRSYDGSCDGLVGCDCDFYRQFSSCRYRNRYDYDYDYYHCRWCDNNESIFRVTRSLTATTTAILRLRVRVQQQYKDDDKYDDK